ncbi:hypothetical protein ACJEAI_001905 [Escherichia coli]
MTVILRWWLCLSGMTDTAPLVLWCCGAVVLWCCGAGWLCYVHWCNVTGRHGGRRCRCGGRPEQPERLRALWLFLRWWLCGVLLPWLGVGMVAHVTVVMMCDMVSARYAALCARSGALT